MKILIGLVAIAAIVVVWLLIPDVLAKYLFFLRVPLIMGSILFLIPFSAQDKLPFLKLSAMLKNLFILRNKWQLTATIVGAVVTGTAIALSSNAILLNSSDRFNLPISIDLPDIALYISAIVLAFPVCLTVAQLAEKNPQRIKNRNFALILGSILSVLFLWGVDFTRAWLFNNEYLKGIISSILALVSKQNTAGYLSATGELNRGHLTAIAFLIVGGISYLIIGLIFHPEAKEDRPEAPALLYVLSLIGILSLFLAGSTFYFDGFRVPVLVVFITISAIAYRLFNVDHFFEINKINRDIQNDGNFKQALDARLQHQQGDKTLVIICASGGGIQAAGWTVQVLSGLQDLLGESFSKAIGLISAVSGGSVGAMYYLDRFDEELGYPPNQELENIFGSSTSDSLDAVGWGFAYLDLWRFIGLPFLIRDKFDRGTAIEKDWQGETKNPKIVKTLDTWRKQVFQGKIPIPVFNATIVEDGRRFLLSPLTFNHIPDPNYTDFNSIYPEYDLSVVTAARLSATFPYVSPICRSNPNVSKTSYHFADGGYFDNSGFVTIAEWLDRWLQPEKELNFKKVLILQINPFPLSTQSPKNEGKPGWFMATIGPLLAMYKVRDPILAARNKAQADMLISKWKGQVEIKYCPIFFPSSSELAEFQGGFDSEFFDEEGQYQPPLSWKLSYAQKAAIKVGWQAIAQPNFNIKSSHVIQEIQDLWQRWHP